jgi:hypothetical protein
MTMHHGYAMLPATATPDAGPGPTWPMSPETRKPPLAAHSLALSIWDMTASAADSDCSADGQWQSVLRAVLSPGTPHLEPTGCT